MLNIPKNTKGTKVKYILSHKAQKTSTPKWIIIFLFMYGNLSQHKSRCNSLSINLCIMQINVTKHVWSSISLLIPKLCHQHKNYYKLL